MYGHEQAAHDDRDQIPPTIDVNGILRRHHIRMTPGVAQLVKWPGGVSTGDQVAKRALLAGDCQDECARARGAKEIEMRHIYMKFNDFVGWRL
jgi:hypothetical protein